MAGSSTLHLPACQSVRALAMVASCEDGAAILEFALVLPILFALLGGAFEIGRALLVRETMIEAVRSGAGYLARVPDPSCDATCTPGVARAVTITLEQILQNSGLPRTAVSVSPHWDAASQTVAMQADLRLDVDLLHMFGLGPVLTVEAIQKERRIAD